MKSPPVQYHDDIARRMVEDFIDGKDDTRLPFDTTVPSTSAVKE